jgi:hypothetical protein
MVLVECTHGFYSRFTLGLENVLVSFPPHQFPRRFESVCEPETVELLKLMQLVLSFAVRGKKLRVPMKNVVASLMEQKLDNGAIQGSAQFFRFFILGLLPSTGDGRNGTVDT